MRIGARVRFEDMVAVGVRVMVGVRILVRFGIMVRVTVGSGLG